MFTAEQVEEMLNAQLAAFKGDGAPPVGGPAAPTETAGDFSAWNEEIAAIEDKNAKP
jgi:hypothetical protein